MNFTQWRMARKYGYASDLIRESVNAFFEQLWYCRIRGQHREKFSSGGRCIRCGKPVR